MHPLKIVDLVYLIYFVILSIVLLIWYIKEYGDVPMPLFILHLVSLCGAFVLSGINQVVFKS